MTIPEILPELEYLDELSPEVLGRLIMLEVVKPTPNIDLIQSCIDAGADLTSIRSKDNEDLLHLVVYHNHMNVLCMLQNNGIDIDAKTPWGRTPLLQAASDGRLDILHFLYKAGANPNARAENGVGILHLAVTNGNTEIIRFLIERGHDIESCDYHNSRPLHWAARFSLFRSDSVDLLLEKGANPNAKDVFGHTPLHTAVNHGCIETVRTLLRHGSHRNAKDNQGLTPWDLATKLIQTQCPELKP